MSTFVSLVIVHFLILVGPSLVITASILRNIKRENFHDRRALAELKLARLHGIAHPEDMKVAA